MASTPSLVKKEGGRDRRGRRETLRRLTLKGAQGCKKGPRWAEGPRGGEGVEVAREGSGRCEGIGGGERDGGVG